MGCDASKDNGGIPRATSSLSIITDEWILNQPKASAKKHHWPSLYDSLSLLQNYEDLDEKCGKLEATCPGPRLATCKAWLEFLNIQRHNLLKENHVIDSRDNKLKTEMNRNIESSNLSLSSSFPKYGTSSHGMDDNLPVVSLDKRKKKMENYYNEQQQQQQQTSESSFSPLKLENLNRNDREKMKTKTRSPTGDFINLALNLNVTSDFNKAAEHEEFFAQLSENAMHSITIYYYNEIMNHTDIRLKILREKYRELSGLYKELDRILDVFNGGRYFSRFEENVDKQLILARDLRDKLGSTLEQWHICGLLLKASHQLAHQSLKQWKKIKTIINPRMKLESALNSRKDVQASLVCLECAQAALPNVAIKNISKRQMTTVKHCILYIITDIINVKRYEHCTKIFANYELNCSKAVLWFYDTFNKTLREDFLNANDNVFSLMKTLRNYREEIYIMQQQQNNNKTD